MLTRSQLDEIRARMEEEHRRDREALDRMMRFLPQNGTPANPIPIETGADADAPLSIMDGIEMLLHQNMGQTWTVQKLRTELVKKGYALKAKNPLATISVAMKKLCDRGKVKVIRRGSGREPNVYQWNTPQIEFEDVERVS